MFVPPIQITDLKKRWEAIGWGKSYKCFWKKKLQPHAFLLLLWYFKKKNSSKLPIFKNYYFFFPLFEGDIRVRGQENGEKIELKCCANKVAKCLAVLGRILSRKGVQCEGWNSAIKKGLHCHLWRIMFDSPPQPPQAVIPPSVIKKETHTLFSVYPLKLADSPTRTIAPPPLSQWRNRQIVFTWGVKLF